MDQNHVVTLTADSCHLRSRFLPKSKTEDGYSMSWMKMKNLHINKMGILWKITFSTCDFVYAFIKTSSMPKVRFSYNIIAAFLFIKGNTTSYSNFIDYIFSLHGNVFIWKNYENKLIFPTSVCLSGFTSNKFV